jgi:hypothetical protein
VGGGAGPPGGGHPPRPYILNSSVTEHQVLPDEPAPVCN